MKEKKGWAAGVGEVLKAFGVLGVTSFGGPIAHLGYFRNEFVDRRKWLSDKDYADLVAVCQFLPGPASSQVGFGLGLMRAGFMGGFAAWLAFTLPSALLLVLFALGGVFLEGPVGTGLITGLKIVAVAIVAHAVWGMARTLCPDRERATIALGAVLLVIAMGGAMGQVMAIAGGALAGLWLCRGEGEASPGDLKVPVSRRGGLFCLVLFVLLLAGLPLAAQVWPVQGLLLVDAFYRAGALVFGGGHVVLPLLEAEVVQSGWVSPDAFLAGYGAAQAVPGPLFTFAAYLGMVGSGDLPALMAAGLALVCIFVPGFLLLLAVLPFWNHFRQMAAARSLMQGANAAVVGILGAALYHPVWTSAIGGPHEFALALAAFVFLSIWKFPSWLVVLLTALGGLLLTFI
ncbi:chromate efflux transporter [Desulfobotulus sp. H1]|uniref:Chromate efflux transporter n=1 Tax=Desulfobotulus pelophilus TaxID=2823377 RepID=A0ABT3N634_9BACT|nr:chromate efflux transporter [Desulfobotulus pelophilus]MCW7752916.1 chromate efflux transporter [Desulfobotulus pelophilus]